MRFIPPKNGDKRTRSFFAWLPVINHKTGETRWLERVNVKEEYKIGFSGGSSLRICKSWVIIEFYDQEI